MNVTNQCNYVLVNYSYPLSTHKRACLFFNTSIFSTLHFLTCHGTPLFVGFLCTCTAAFIMNTQEAKKSNFLSKEKLLQEIKVKVKEVFFLSFPQKRLNFYCFGSEIFKTIILRRSKIINTKRLKSTYDRRRSNMGQQGI